MTEDIVKRLEAACIDWNTAKMIDETRPADWLTVGDVRDAVAEIQRLAADRAALRAALSELAKEFRRTYPIYYYSEPWGHTTNQPLLNAEALLAALEARND